MDLFKSIFASSEDEESSEEEEEDDVRNDSPITKSAPDHLSELQDLSSGRGLSQ